MLTRIAVLGGILLAAACPVSPAQALTLQECSAKFKTAQDAGTLNGMKWNDFRQANCGSSESQLPAKPADAATQSAATSAAPAPAAVPRATTAAKPMTAPPGVPFPTAISSKYSAETPSRARMHTCLDQYRLDKANNALGGLKWLQKGGGYYSICNARLKG
ncbi:MAG TPA: hypothetical protein VL418_09895 [Devosiaceae bacterium]|nr:hypothetical protein [Devosiaceae bacterium]